MSTGKVWLVGAGPGDPAFLTLRGREVLDQAETVVYDRLVSEEILLTLPPKVRLINAGKVPHHHPLPQEEINRLLIGEARKGRRVVRLKGGDPFLFGRGGEELLALRDAGIPVEAVPGISSALAVPAGAGIPVTHRGLSSGLHIISWHGREDGPPGPEVLRGLTSVGGTLVILMGGSELGEISHHLIQEGFSPDVPAAIITGGTTPRQRVFRTLLGSLGKAEPEENNGPLFPGRAPVLVVIGPVCSLGYQMPVDRVYTEESAEPFISLKGARMVVTRPEPTNAETCGKIHALGGVPIPFPCVRIRPVSGWGSSWRETLGSSQWLVFTSAKGVNYFFNGFLSSGGDLRFFAERKFAAVGTATAEALAGWGFIPDCMPPVFNGTQLGLALIEQMSPGEEALLIRSQVSEKGLDRILKERAIPFRELVVYETLPAEGSSIARDIIGEGRFDFVLFFSPSAVPVFAAACSGQGVKALCIGTATAVRAKGFGMETYTPAEASFEGLCRLAVELISRNASPKTDERFPIP
ncbi:uroporphyrinogen-III C-methyltransferase [Treponema sp. TIM-1]|uniref:uroporphyrinogen-III C-methyltransferase n=1 Tax=Treponema sp. TIM-1 TaxID=2898417 RepID=UPI00397EEDE8